MIRPRSRGWLKWAGRGSAVLFAAPLAYLLAALIGGLVPANRDWQPPTHGITVFLETNGVHTWIAVPAVSRGMDWRPITPASHIRNPLRAGNYVAFGYGNREFYLNTPEWKDLTVRRALGAAFGGGPGLVHVYHEHNPTADRDRRPIVLNGEQYHRLAEFILASFDRDRAGRTIPLIGRGYGDDDIFYEGRGGYNLFYSCNEWTGSALRAAGVKIGIWTPFAQSVMARFR